MNLEVSPNWEWVGSLLTVGTNVKIRGLASESPEETYETRNKLDFQSYQRFILTLFCIYYIYLIYFDKLPIVLWSCVWLSKRTSIKIFIVYSILFLWKYLSEKEIQPKEDPTVGHGNRRAGWQVELLECCKLTWIKVNLKTDQMLCLWWPHRGQGLLSI